MKIKKSGNILITVVFLLFIISLMGIIVTKYVQNIVNYSDELSKYFNAYYKAYAGIEIGLTKIKNHDYGFEDAITADSSTNTNNFKYCKMNKCYFEYSIKSRSTLLVDKPNAWEESSCNTENAYALSGGGGFLIPLYRDDSEGEGTLKGNSVSYLSKSNFLNNELKILSSQNKKFALGLAVSDTLTRNIAQKTGLSSPQNLKMNTITEINISDYSEHKKSFFLASNIQEGTSQSFCLSSPMALPTKYVTLNSVGRYGDRFVSLQAIKTNALPDYLIYNILN